MTSRIICLAVGIVVATMALGYERHVVIVITGLCGGIGAVKCAATAMAAARNVDTR